jgi:hypothetical protein
MYTYPANKHGYLFLKQIKVIDALKVKNRNKVNNLINFRQIENMMESPGPKSRFPVRWV